MVLITLVGEKQAKEGYEFIYLGSLSECKECKLKTVCFNLEQGLKYRVKNARTKHHNCNIHEEGVRVVEVEKVPFPIGIDSNLAIEGSTIDIKESACNNIGCVNRHVCFPCGFYRGTKYRISKVTRDMECPDGKKLKEVMIEQEKSTPVA
ncbi:MAG: UPF0179 family protein [Thermoplasmata archaeon]